MVDDDVGVDVNIDIVTAIDHGSELGVGTTPAVQVIRDRLVAGPPLTTRDVFIRG